MVLILENRPGKQFQDINKANKIIAMSLKLAILSGISIKIFSNRILLSYNLPSSLTSASLFCLVKCC